MREKCCHDILDKESHLFLTNTSSNRSSRAGGSHLPHTSTSMNEGEGDSSKVPKVRKRHKVHTLCCQCTMWEQTGSDSNLTHLHSYKQYMRHPISEEQANISVTRVAYLCMFL